jgi:hypothetical protein
VSIRRAPRPERGFTQIDNDVHRDRRISFKARGVLGYMLSFPDDWRLDHRTIARDNGVGREQVATALKELRAVGYLVQERRRGEKGQWVTDTVLYDRSQEAPPSTGNPDPDGPDPDGPDLYEDCDEDCDEEKDGSPSAIMALRQGQRSAQTAARKPKKPNDHALLRAVLQGLRDQDVNVDDPEEIEAVTRCLRRCYKAKHPGAWLKARSDAGDLDGILGSRGLGPTCANCSPDEADATPGDTTTAGYPVHEHHDHVVAKCERLTHERRLPLTPTELVTWCYHLGRGDAWTGSLLVDRHTNLTLTGEIRDPAAAFRARLAKAAA